MALRHNRQRLGMPLGEDIDDKMLTEVLLESSKSYEFSMAYWGLFKTCNLNVSFTPKESRLYEFEFKFLNKKTCGLTIWEMVENEDNKFIKINDKSAIISNNSCMPGVLK